MDTTELLKRVRKIEIKTKGLSKQIFSGEYHSAFKGRGMAFSEVRDYMPGDDIRNIDWNVTARYNHPYVKVFEEERELTVMLLVDISASGKFGTSNQSKKNLITELCAVLAFSAINNNDKIGAILFSNQVEKFIPPKKGKSHTLRIIRELLEFEPQHSETSIAAGLQHFNNAIKKKSIAFLISDFMDKGFDDPLKIAARKHDLIALKIYDKREESLPNIGLVNLTDVETGKSITVDTGRKRIRNAYKQKYIERDKALISLFGKSKVDNASISTDEDYVKPLIQLFKRRGAKV
ncbi:MAG: DUF58 domain-containing protein [Bacteroidia bacterium]|nr:DUF58 domain-containing protein [Bacteroidia bacterium]NNC84610.1 DUF58 domain-containing protein [Bacteroidia bacterium]NNM15885.1 DUF58 domain-containing protein [Bacteroidia bacterium]